MADDILSQDEVDALLRGVSGDTEEQPADDKSVKGVRPYDIGRQERIVRGRMPTLELINERFARLLRISLYSHLRRSPEIAVGPVRVIKYSDFTRNLPVPTNLNLVHAKPLRGSKPMQRDRADMHGIGPPGRSRSRCCCTRQVKPCSGQQAPPLIPQTAQQGTRQCCAPPMLMICSQHPNEALVW